MIMLLMTSYYYRCRHRELSNKGLILKTSMLKSSCQNCENENTEECDVKNHIQLQLTKETIQRSIDPSVDPNMKSIQSSQECQRCSNFSWLLIGVIRILQHHCLSMAPTRSTSAWPISQCHNFTTTLTGPHPPMVTSRLIGPTLYIVTGILNVFPTVIVWKQNVTLNMLNLTNLLVLLSQQQPIVEFVVIVGVSLQLTPTPGQVKFFLCSLAVFLTLSCIPTQIMNANDV